MQCTAKHSGRKEVYARFHDCRSCSCHLADWVKFSADNILKYFFYFSEKTGYDISCKLSQLETICMKCQIMFIGEK